MKIRLIKIGEPLPIDEGSPRLLRMSILAQYLSDRGHDVHFWTSTMDFRSKKLRASHDKVVEVKPNYKIEMAHAEPYQKNLSYARVRHNKQLNEKLARSLESSDKPDVIFCAYPVPEHAATAVAYGKRHGVPVIVDVRDLWPDIIAERLPAPLKPFSSLLLRSSYRSAKAAFSGATGISGITPEFVDWGLRYAGREKGPFDRHFYFGYPKPEFTEQELSEARSRLKSKGIEPRPDELVVTYLGNLNVVISFDTVAECFRQLHKEGHPIRLYVCGQGNSEQRFIEMTRDCPNVVFGGWVGAPEIWSLLQMTDIGLLCYVSTFDFESSIPNKIPEYFAAGLPVLSSLKKGVLNNLLNQEKVGMVYPDTPEELKETLLSLHQDRARLSEMSQNAKNLFESRFKAETVYSELCDHLENVANNA